MLEIVSRRVTFVAAAKVRWRSSSVTGQNLGYRLIREKALGN
jgi:hypothetical protein